MPEVSVLNPPISPGSPPMHALSQNEPKYKAKRQAHYIISNIFHWIGVGCKICARTSYLHSETQDVWFGACIVTCVGLNCFVLKPVNACKLWLVKWRITLFDSSKGR